MVLPRGWEDVEIGQICELYQPQTISTKQMNIDGQYFVYGANGIIGRYEKYNHEESELLITCRGATCGNVHITKEYSWINGNAMVVKPFTKDTISLIYLKFLFLTGSRTKKAISGTAQPQITRTTLSPIKVPIPPIAEQHRIVAKIEELFSSLDKGIESLKTAQAQLKTYRQAVLKWAFEGKLTNENVKEGELPEGWKWEKLGDIGKIKGGKRLPPKHKYSEIPTQYIYIMAGNLKEGTVKNQKTYIQEKTYKVLSNYKVTGGEVYITIVGACIGDAGLIPENIGNAILTENAAKIVDLKQVYNKFLSNWINSIICQSQIKQNILSATLGKLALSRISTLLTPVPPTISEQQLIVSEIEKRLSVCDKLEESISQSLSKAEALRQSILKKAFEGKLVPQDPSDEPASVLLERIRLERSTNTSVKKTRTPSGKN